MRTESSKLFAAAQKTIPGGVNSPVRAFNGVGGTPIFIHSAKGAYLYDEDGNRYVDFVGSWGPMILGHQDPDVLSAIHRALESGLSFGAPTRAEVLLADTICDLIPSIEQIRMVSSGTEATMTAIRLARGYTKRDLIIKFNGCYHGHCDSLLVQSGSGALTLGQPSSSGVPYDVAKHTLTLEYNNTDQLQQAFAKFGDQIASVMVEPIAGNMNCVLPDIQFLKTMRQLCTQYQSVLIFDEVITGFRVALQGAQSLYEITPCITTFGKIIGGGMPVGALGGKREIMQHLAPTGSVYQAGTLSGNPVAMAAGLATLKKLQNCDFYQTLHQKTQQLIHGFLDIAKQAGIPLHMNWTTGIFGLFFSELDEVKNLSDVKQSDLERFKKFYHAMLNKGVYFGPSAFECAFVSGAHDETSIDYTLSQAQEVFRHL